VLWATGQPLLVFTYGVEFGMAETIFQLLVIEASLGALSQVSVQLFLSADRPGVVSSIQVIVLAVSLGAMLVLVPPYGAVGAALGLAAAGLVRWLLLLGAIRQVLRLPLPRLYLTPEDIRYMLGRLH
jgi:O-antigen/teichoic acid export membrane protein